MIAVPEQDSRTQVDLAWVLFQLGDDATAAALNDPRNSPRLNQLPIEFYKTEMAEGESLWERTQQGTVKEQRHT